MEKWPKYTQLCRKFSFGAQNGIVGWVWKLIWISDWVPTVAEGRVKGNCIWRVFPAAVKAELSCSNLLFYKRDLQMLVEQALSHYWSFLTPFPPVLQIIVRLFSGRCPGIGWPPSPAQWGMLDLGYCHKVWAQKKQLMWRQGLQKTAEKSEGPNAVLAFSFSLQTGYAFQSKKRETR